MSTGAEGSQASPAVGEVIGHYQVLAELGQGGMGTVYLALDRRLERRVALKFLRARPQTDPAARERFLREARAAAALNHPNVVAVHEIGEHAGQVYIVMDYLLGRTLQQRLREPGGAEEIDPTSLTQSVSSLDPHAAPDAPAAVTAMGDPEIVDVALQLCRGLAAAHAAGIVHRDVKPQNVLVDESGHARIVDFGLAKLRGAQPLTGQLTTMGTVHYMSPEQASGGDVDHRTDLWSLGVVLYQMMTGELPFRGETPQAVLHSILQREPAPFPAPRSGAARRLQRVVAKALAKDRNVRFESAAAMERALREVRRELEPAPGPASFLRLVARPRIALPVLAVLGVGAVWLGRWLQQQSRVEWAHDVALPEVLSLVEEGATVEAFALAREAESVIPGSALLEGVWDRISNSVSVRTQPPGARVGYREYSDSSGAWTPLGATPLEDVRLPAGILRVRLEAEGFETREVVRRVALPDEIARLVRLGFYPEGDPTWELDFALDPEGSLPEGMVAVEGGTYSDMPILGFPQEQPMELARYLIDRTEVANRDYQEFVEAGGYARHELWQRALDEAGAGVGFEEATSGLLDSTDRPGPRGWVMGEPPEGLDSHPVEGVSWFEAAAYCEYRGKRLPTVYHWAFAAFPTWERDEPLHPLMIPLSNFDSEGTAPVGSSIAIGVSGASDLAGNVREWCWNASGADRYSLGAAWTDAGKIVTSGHAQPPWNRTPGNGFRCASYPEGEPGEPLTAAVLQEPLVDWHALPGRTDQEWGTFSDRYYRYFPSPLNATVDSSGDSPIAGREEWVSVDAPYGDERLPIRLHIPDDADPPYQAVLFFPGSDLEYVKSIRDSDADLAETIGFVVKSGRVLVQPVFQKTMERSAGRRDEHPSTDQVTWGHWVMEVSRTLDYLEEREDVDATRVAYAGFSLGATMARDVLAIDDRFRAALLWMGGFWRDSDLDYVVDQVDCTRRTATPVLMINGRYDLIFDLDTEVTPMFELLGTPAEHKRLVVYDLGHSLRFPRGEFIRENLAWLDTYLGSVEGAAGSGASR
jgi:dienelactone hydrolase/tRNA A-37 threonylcarbamoyl transferase component Bud32